MNRIQITLALALGALLAVTGSAFAKQHAHDEDTFAHAASRDGDSLNVDDPSHALACDSSYATVFVKGHVTLDIGHSRHFVDGDGPDVTVQTVGRIQYRVSAQAYGSTEWHPLGTSQEPTQAFDLGRSGAFQYIRIANLSVGELLVDCFQAHHLEEHDH